MLPRWLRNLRIRHEFERDLDAELAAHRDLLTDEQIKAGATLVTARRAAQLEMGGLEVIKEGVRDVRAGASLESWLRDVQYGLRQLRRAPLFAASVATTIGLGLGVFGSAFTILNAYVLRPVDLPNPYQLYALNWDTATERRHRFSLVDFEALCDGAPFFSGLVAAEEAPVMQDGNPAVGLLVTANYFQVLGARAAMGRLLAPNDADPQVAVQSCYHTPSGDRTTVPIRPSSAGRSCLDDSMSRLLVSLSPGSD